MLNLDTHILIFALCGELRARERGLLERDRWSISAIVPWKLAKLVQLGRVDVDLDDRDVMRTLSSMSVGWGNSRRNVSWRASLPESHSMKSSPVAGRMLQERCRLPAPSAPSPGSVRASCHHPRGR